MCAGDLDDRQRNHDRGDPVQVWDETHSTFMVGLVGIAAFVPLVTVSIVAGAIADAVDRRRLLLLSDLGLAAVTVVLLLNALADDPSLPLLFACEAAATSAYAFQRPARNALTPKLVPSDQLLAAIAVEDVVFNLARVAGPALAEVLIATVGFGGAYALRPRDVRRIARRDLAAAPAAEDRGRGEVGLRSILEGFKLVGREPALLGIFTVDTVAMIFGMPSALFPAFGEELGGARPPSGCCTPRRPPARSSRPCSRAG